MNSLIIAAFRRWRRRHLPPGAIVDRYHVWDFFVSLSAPGETHAPGAWELVHGALRQAEIVGPAEHHIGLCGVYLGPGAAEISAARARRSSRLPASPGRSRRPRP
jgi:hypothetical protein